MQSFTQPGSTPFSSIKQGWLTACQELEQHGQPYCIATVVAEVGSVPRARGAKMVITPTHQYDTLGGGNLEFQVIQKAREGLAQHKQQASIERFSLAADLGQCCGGAVQVLLEFMQTNQPKVVVFGAGHVCHSLTSILRELPYHLTVVDTRSEWLEPLSSVGITTHCCDEPASMVAELSSNSHLVVMTQDHSLDYAIVSKALEQNRFSFVGLIGSESKNQRFRFRLEEQLKRPELIEPLICPIGHPDVQGKLPMQVAVSISAQLIERFANSETQHQAEHLSKQSWQAANQARQSLKQVSL